MSALLMAAAGSMLLARAVRDELGAWSPCGPARPSPGSRTRRRRPPAAHQAAAAVPLGPCCTPRRPDQRRRTDLRSWPELVPYTAGNPCWGNAAFLSRSTTARPLLLDNSAARRGMHRGGGCGLLGRAPRAWVVTSGTASAPIPNSTQSRDGSSVQSFHAPPASTLFCRWPAPRAPPLPARPPPCTPPRRLRGSNLSHAAAPKIPPARAIKPPPLRSRAELSCAISLLLSRRQPRSVYPRHQAMSPLPSDSTLWPPS
jgi:hypothetical protein